MIGVFDSGRGGTVAYRELRRLMPRADLTLLADRKNAPYGGKRPEEILRLTEGGIKRLRDMGAEVILIACCTASSLHEYLPKWARDVSLPIIEPCSRLCDKSRSVLVVATEHTVRCGVFRREIARFSNAGVTEVPMQPLVSLIEWGLDTKSAEEDIARLCRENEADTLILGCTHFSHLLTRLQARLPEVKILSPAHIGAREIRRITIDRGRGYDRYTI